MADIVRASLFGKLNSLSYRALESATVFCKLRSNPQVELVHWLNQLLQQQDSDLHRILRHYEVDHAHLARDLTRALDSLPRGAATLTGISSWLDEAVQEAWLYASLMFGDHRIRSGYVIVGLLKQRRLAELLASLSREFTKIKADSLTDEFAKITAGSPEEQPTAQDGATGGGLAPGENSEAIAPAALGKQEALKRFSVDLTAQARDGKMDPILGRDTEIRQIVDILMRRRQNNPILTGEAGVGKTAVVEGFAQRIAAGDVPPPLQHVTVRTLDMGLLQAGASMKGEFENRLRQVIDEVQASPTPIILFIDEAHTLIGAGGAAGQNDAANLLKPALARGTLRTIAATTWAEYKKYFEKDPALTRRFQVVQVDEPDEAKALLMMRGLASALERHHRVQVLDEALAAAVSISHRYIPARQLPDKAVSLLDTACARVAISQHSIPPAIADTRQRLAALTTEQQLLTQEEQTGSNHAERLAAIATSLQHEHDTLASLESRWQHEKRLVDQILAARAKLRASGQALPPTPADTTADAATGELAPDVPALRRDLDALQRELAALQGETPMILPSVDAQAIAAVVADWTGIPVGRMVRNEIQAVLNLGQTLATRVIGQDHALEAISQRIRISRAAMENPTRPIGVFLLVGPSGVGKTETALALADSLYGGEQNVITINMSEFQEAHTVSTLKGAPPGYVGYGEGGILTEAVRRRPYSIVLLDEVEKAHPDVHEIFFQVFDKGQMEDGEGRLIDFKNTIILLTSNVGSDLIMSMCADPDLMPDQEALAKALREPLRKVFPAALLGRLVVVPYFPITRDTLRLITALQLRRVERRLHEHHRIPITWAPEVFDTIVARCSEPESGARLVDAIISQTLLPQISNELLHRMLQDRPLAGIAVGANEQGFTYTFS